MNAYVINKAYQDRDGEGYLQWISYDIIAYYLLESSAIVAMNVLIDELPLLPGKDRNIQAFQEGIRFNRGTLAPTYFISVIEIIE